MAYFQMNGEGKPGGSLTSDVIMDYFKKVYEAINEFVGKYQDNPFNFLYEADIRSILFSILFQKFETESITLQGGWFHNIYGGGDSIQTIPVTNEAIIEKTYCENLP
jgi:hypothetical protein